MVRRVIIQVRGVKKMLEDMANPPKDMETIIANLPPDSIPHHFFCVITQDIMKNPVSTVDKFTYEKEAIERWLTNHDTSPLTGLPLAKASVSSDSTNSILSPVLHENPIKRANIKNNFFIPVILICKFMCLQQSRLFQIFISF